MTITRRSFMAASAAAFVATRTTVSFGKRTRVFLDAQFHGFSQEQEAFLNRAMGYASCNGHHQEL